jgi:hypothetical protein
MLPPQTVSQMTERRWWMPRHSTIAQNMLRWPQSWRFHMKHLDTFLQQRPEAILEGFGGFYCGLFDNWEHMSEGFVDVVESREFARAIAHLECFDDLENDKDLQGQMWKYARRIMDHRNDGELYTYLFEDVIHRIIRQFEDKKAAVEAEKKRRHAAIYSELMEKAWNPRRFQVWCCDIEEQAMFRSMGWDGGYYEEPATAGGGAAGGATPAAVTVP